MAKQLLQEYFELCPEGRCPIHILTESEKKSIMEGAVYLVGVCQRAGSKNGNGRMYNKKTLAREVEKYQEAIVERRSLGELDHPDDSVINLKNASHLVTKMWWQGDDVMGKIEVLETPSGNILKSLVKSGVKLGISSRGLGSTEEKNGLTLVKEDFEFICLDIVSTPSTDGAWLTPDTRTKKPNMDSGVSLYINENKKVDKVSELLDSILRD